MYIYIYMWEGGVYIYIYICGGINPSQHLVCALFEAGMPSYVLKLNFHVCVSANTD